GGGGRQAGQVEGDAAGQGGAVGFRRRAEALFFQAGGGEAGGGGAHPLLILGGGGDAGLRRLEGPGVAPGRDGFGDLVGGGVGAVVDPALQQRDLGGAEAGLALGRHGDDVVGAGDGVDEPAGVTLAGHDGGPGVAALERPPGGVEAQA